MQKGATMRTPEPLPALPAPSMVLEAGGYPTE
jgi:hypothetical protein